MRRKNTQQQQSRNFIRFKVMNNNRRISLARCLRRCFWSLYVRVSHTNVEASVGESGNIFQTADTLMLMNTTLFTLSTYSTYIY